MAAAAEQLPAVFDSPGVHPWLPCQHQQALNQPLPHQPLSDLWDMKETQDFRDVRAGTGAAEAGSVGNTWGCGETGGLQSVGVQAKSDW